MAIASGSDDGTACLWDIRFAYQPTHTLGTQPATTPTYISAPQPATTPPTTSASGAPGPTSGLGLCAKNSGEAESTSMCFSPNGRMLFIGQGSGPILQWDTISSQLYPPLAAQGGRKSSLAVSPDGRFFVSGSWDNSVAFWPF